MSNYQLPHPLDRPNQPEVLEWILESDKKYLILNAPTGFGKSPIAAAYSLDFRTLVLVLHKSLQSANYRDQYSFDILYGKGNYPCKKPSKQLKGNVRITAYDCGNPECFCPYQVRLMDCLQSQRVCLNYAKYLSTRDIVHNYEPDILFLDEAHNLPEIITEFVGITLDYDNEFLKLIGSVRPAQPCQLNHNEAMVIFRQLARACELNKPTQSEDLMRWRKWKRLHTSISITNEILGNGSLNDWYYESTDKSLIIKPLTAKYHFKRLFNTAEKVVLMSATIRPNIASRLGIQDDEYDYMAVPSNWPIPLRLVYDLQAPSLNRESSEIDRYLQAQLIAGLLRSDKSGIIHTMSKSQSFELADRLRHFGVRTHVPEVGIGTEQQLEQWYQYRRPGLYCISWSFHEGVDLGGDDINIMAKTPYTSLASNYEKAKKNYDPGWYKLKAAQTTEQLFGRHQRGVQAHYGNGKLAFIADSSWRGIKSLLSEDFKLRIRNWNGKII